MSDFLSNRVAMVDTQVRPSDVTKFPIIEAMLNIPRERFVPQSLVGAAYMGKNLVLEDGAVILEPRTLAKLLDALDIRNDELVLDIGSTLGYSSAVIARMAEAVVAVESEPGRAADIQSSFAEQHVDNVIVQEGPLVEGAPEHGPYDVIVLQGGVEKMPESLLDQLKVGGRIACLFMKGAVGDARLGVKTQDGVTWRSIFNAGAPVLSGFEVRTEFAL